MEKEEIAKALIVIFVLIVLFVGFFSLFPEVRDNIGDFTEGFLGLGFAKSDEEIRATVKLAADSFDACSNLIGNGCVCDIELDVIPGDNSILIDNGGSESKFVLINENQQADAPPWNLGGRKVGVAVPYFDGTSFNAYCNFDNFIFNYDSGWTYRVAEVGTATAKFGIKKLVSSDQVSQYPAVKLEDGNFCLFDEWFVGYEYKVGEKANTVDDLVGMGVLMAEDKAKLVKIGALPVVKGTFSDYYSGKEFFNFLPKCNP